MAKAQVEAQVALGVLQGTVEGNFLSVDSSWDPNLNRSRQLLTQYKKWILSGIRNAIPKAIIWSKLYEIKQDRKESPTDFVNKLKDSAQKYITIDPDSEEGRNQLAPLFIGQSSDDIRRKLQKLQGQDNRDLGKLLELAWTVYKNRDRQKETVNSKLIAILNGGNPSEGGRGRG